MPWKETSPVDQRKRFVMDLCKKKWTIRELCHAYGISRPTAYKWINRFHEFGPEGLQDRSHAAHSHPNATDSVVEEALIVLRKRHRFWGPKKLLHRLSVLHPELDRPAPSTVGEIIKRRGLIEPRRRKYRAPPYRYPMGLAREPNDVWAADFKGWFRTKDWTRIDPLTITDGASRYLLCCQGVERPDYEFTRPIFKRCFKEYGLPWSIRIDNGPPFGSVGIGGLTSLSVWWIRLGIKPERIRPGHPEDNGKHERMHRTLKQETANPPKANPRLQQRAFNTFQSEYNEIRPHEALGMQPPARRYRPSSRPFPNRLRQLEYTGAYTLRQIRSGGQMKWRGQLIHVGIALKGQTVGLIEVDNDVWRLDFGPLQLGLLHGRNRQIKRL